MQVFIPEFGQGLCDVVLVSLRVKTGDYVQRGDEIALVESDKAIHPIEASCSGTVGQVMAIQATRMKVGDIICLLHPDGEPTDAAKCTAAKESRDEFVIRRADINDMPDIFRIWSENQHRTSARDETASIQKHYGVLSSSLLGLSEPFFVSVATIKGVVDGWVSLLPCRNNPMIREHVGEVSLYVNEPDAAINPAMLLLRHLTEHAKAAKMKFLLGYSSSDNARVAKLLSGGDFRRLGAVSENATHVWSYDCGTPARVRSPKPVNSEVLKRTVAAMFASRSCDEIECSLIRQGTSQFHLGGEGVEIAAILNLFLKDDDRCFLHFRDRALRLTRGLTIQEFAAGFFAVSGTEGSGKSMTCHESSLAHHVFPIATPVASHCLPACGAAWDQVLSSERNAGAAITVCSLGDGSTRQGEFLEAVAFALDKRLPLLFVVIDNAYAISTQTIGKTALDLRMVPKGIITSINGWEPASVFEGFEVATRLVRVGDGPRIVRLHVPRLAAHSSLDDEKVYRSTEEIREGQARDPLPIASQWFVEQSFLSQSELDNIKADQEILVQCAYESMSKESKTPIGVDSERPTVSPTGGTTIHSLSPSTVPHSRLRDAVNGALAHILENDPGRSRNSNAIEVLN